MKVERLERDGDEWKSGVRVVLLVPQAGPAAEQVPFRT